MELVVFATHPIQYQVPIWRKLDQHHGVNSRVVYCCDHGVSAYKDEEFNATFAWDLPLLDGYSSEILRTGSLSTKNILKVRNCRAVLERLAADCILVQGYFAPYTRQIRVLAKKLGIKLIVRGEFTDRRPASSAKRIIADFYRRWFYKGVDAFCYIGVDAITHLHRFGIPDSQLFYSPYCIDTDYFEAQKINVSRIQARALLGIPTDAIVFLFSGKMIDRKQPLVFGQALLELRDQENLYCIAIGEGPQRSAFESLLRPVFNNRVIIPGFVNQSELAKYFTAADVLVLPSQFDSWGLVVNEAMQFGLPVIVSDMVGCAPDLVKTNETGFIFPVGNVYALAQSMLQFLNSPGLSAKMGAQAIELVSRYSTTAAADGILQAAYSVTSKL